MIALDGPVRHEPLTLVAPATLGYVPKKGQRVSIADRGVWRFLDTIYNVLVAGYGDVGIFLNVVSPKVYDSWKRYTRCSVIEAILLETEGQCLKVWGARRLAIRRGRL